MSDDANKGNSQKNVVSKKANAALTSTQQPVLTLTTVPRKASPEADASMERFLTDTIFNLNSRPSLPPNTPNGPKSKSHSRKVSSTGSRSVNATPDRPSTKTRSPFSFVCHNRDFESNSTQKLSVVTPIAKSHAFWSRDREESPCPVGARRKLHVGWDHWSPVKKPRRDLFDYSPKASRVVESRTLSEIEGHRSLGIKHLQTKDDYEGQAKKFHKGLTEGKGGGRADTKEENLSLLKTKAVGPSLERKKSSGLLAVDAPGHGQQTEGKKAICFNCGKTGHEFLDCLVKCGHCGKDGHKTFCCKMRYPKSTYSTKKG
ncbi:hypothetical protein ONS95_002597 [Cadophora gregata]|nr:uncharacterized protein ONS95_002597 [Cadophora gregata]KAK0109928.1 hypothetical protein ONS95_002597 [Cadophora gregata]